MEWAYQSRSVTPQQKQVRAPEQTMLIERANTREKPTCAQLFPFERRIESLEIFGPLNDIPNISETCRMVPLIRDNGAVHEEMSKYVRFLKAFFRIIPNTRRFFQKTSSSRLSYEAGS